MRFTAFGIKNCLKHLAIEQAQGAANRAQPIEPIGPAKPIEPMASYHF